MCGIFGIVFQTPIHIDLNSRKVDLPPFMQDFPQVFDRGRDTVGFTAILKDAQGIFFRTYKEDYHLNPHHMDPEFIDDKIDHVISKTLFDSEANRHHVVGKTHLLAIIGNARGVPTTETNVRNFNQLPWNEIQPYLDDQHTSVVVHNGLISNDKAILSNTEFENRIDSYAILYAMRHGMIDHLQGSYAFCHVDTKGILTLARNYLGVNLRTASYSGNKFTVFSSEQFNPSTCYDWYKDYELPFDTVASLNLQEINEIDLSRPDTSWKTRSTSTHHHKAVVVISGGLDSTTCAHLIAGDSKYTHVHLMHFYYGAKASEPERQAVARTAALLSSLYPEKHIGVSVQQLSFLKDLGGSTLTDPTLQVTKGEVGAETTSEWVPARNFVMIAHASAWCDVHGYDTIVLGANREEASVYSDNAGGFYNSLNVSLRYATKKRVQLVQPLVNRMKHQIVKIARSSGVDFNNTWSCYNKGPKRCGICGPCLNTSRAFAMANIEDHFEYESDPTSV